MPYQPGRTTGFTSIGDYLDANQGTLADESKAVSSDAMKNLDGAQSAADQVIAKVQPGQGDYTTTAGYADAQGKLQDAEEQAQNLNDPGALGDDLSQHYGLSSDQQQFDGNLLQASNPDFSAVTSRAKSISDYLDSGSAAQAAKPVPVTTAPPASPVADDPATPPEPKDPEPPVLQPSPDPESKPKTPRRPPTQSSPNPGGGAWKPTKPNDPRKGEVE